MTMIKNSIIISVSPKLPMVVLHEIVSYVNITYYLANTKRS
jgi:hypothetical protein